MGKEKKEQNQIVINIGSLVGKLEIAGELTDDAMKKVKDQVTAAFIEAMNNIRE